MLHLNHYLIHVLWNRQTEAKTGICPILPSPEVPGFIPIDHPKWTFLLSWTNSYYQRHLITNCKEINQEITVVNSNYLGSSFYSAVNMLENILICCTDLLKYQRAHKNSPRDTWKQTVGPKVWSITWVI